MILTPCKVVIIISYINVKTEKNMKEFKVKAYGKSELAMLYFPDAGSAHTAVNHLMKMGYRKSDKFFTPKQVAVIAEYLGEP